MGIMDGPVKKDNVWLSLEPLKEKLNEEELELIEINSGIKSYPIHYPMLIKTEEIGGVINITNSPINPLEIDES